MEDQYVYVARLVNHKNEFLDGYYKLGKTKQYSIREKQLNSTNMPFEALMVRVFKTDNMTSTESILHTCFEDYRVIMSYEDKKKRRTEWFFVDDEEKLYNRIDKLISNLNIQEVDLEPEIKTDNQITQKEKEELIKFFRKSKTRLHLLYNGEDITQETSTDTFLLALKTIASQSSWDVIMENEIRVTRSLEELRDRNPSANPSQLKSFEGYYVFTGNNNDVKLKNLNKLIRKLNIKNLQITIKK